MTFQVATEEELVEVWRRAMAPDYRRGLETENDGFGMDIVYAQAAILRRVAEAVGVSTQAYYLRPHSAQVRPEAARERRAVGSVLVSRAGNATGPITLTAGVELVAMVHDVTGALIEASRYRVTSDVTIGVGSGGPVSVPVECERYGYQGNVPAGRIVSFVLLGRFSIPVTIATGNEMADSFADPGEEDRITPKLLGRYVRFPGGPNAGTYPRRVVSVTTTATPLTASNTMVVDGPALVVGSGVAEVEEWYELGLSVEMETPFTGGVHGWEDAIGEERLTFRQVGETDAAYRERISDLADVVSPGAILRTCARILGPLGIPYRMIEAKDPENFVGYAWAPSLVGTGVMGVPFAMDYSTQKRRFAIVVGSSGVDDFGTDTDVYLGEDDMNDVDGDAYTDGFPYVWTHALQALYAAINDIKSAGVAWNILLDPAYF